MTLPVSWSTVAPGIESTQLRHQWYRCTLRISKGWLRDQCLLSASTDASTIRAWLNGTELKRMTPKEAAATQAAEAGKVVFVIPQESVTADDANLLVIHCELPNPGSSSLDSAAVHSGQGDTPLNGRWQVRLGTDATWSNIPLPAKFGTGSDIVFDVR